MQGKKYGELYDRTIAKEKTILGAGHKLITIWEYDFKIIEAASKSLPNI